MLPALGSDHHGLLFTVQPASSPSTKQPTQEPKFNTSKADWDLFSTKLAVAFANRPILSNCGSIPFPSAKSSMALLIGQHPALEQQLDQLGSALTDGILEAARASIPKMKLGPRPKPWWNPDLCSLRTAMLQAQRTFHKELAKTSPAESFLWKRDFLLARNAYFQAIKAAKKDHWNHFLEKEDPKSIFKAMAYTKDSASQQILLGCIGLTKGAR